MPSYTTQIWGEEAWETFFLVAFCMRYIYKGKMGEHSIKQKVHVAHVYA